MRNVDALRKIYEEKWLERGLKEVKVEKMHLFLFSDF